MTDLNSHKRSISLQWMKMCCIEWFWLRNKKKKKKKKRKKKKAVDWAHIGAVVVIQQVGQQ